MSRQDSWIGRARRRKLQLARGAEHGRLLFGRLRGDRRERIDLPALLRDDELLDEYVSDESDGRVHRPVLDEATDIGTVVAATSISPLLKAVTLTLHRGAGQPDPGTRQGMTLAAMEGVALEECLASGVQDLLRRFHAAPSKRIDVPWKHRSG
jgi:hypothetical protein